MGSSGSGRFSDYPGTGGPKAGSGGKGSDDRCARAFSVSLEDVEHSQYYSRTGGVPPVGIVLSIEHRKRIVAVTASGESVGNLPTSFNYLAECLAGGFKYVGHVTSSSAGPTAILIVDFAPT